MAIEEEPIPALQRFADSVAVARGLGPGQLRFQDWGEALRTALAPRTDEATGLVVIDELPYLLAHPAGASIPSTLQALVDENRDAADSARLPIIVCGSALAVMSELLSGGKPL
jgi:hypothetical protein